MSRARVYTEESIAVMTRMFTAVDMLIAQKKIKNKLAYCTIAGIDRTAFNAQKKDVTRGYFQVSWLLPLIKDFNFSAEWLLTGSGDVFKKEK